MNTVIAGKFEGKASARQAIGALAEAGFDPDRIASFLVDPQGQPNANDNPEDADASAGEQDAETGAVAGVITGVGIGAVVGLAALPVVGPAAPFAGAAVGAYVGSFAGALDGMDARPANEPSAETDSIENEGAPGSSGTLVAVATASSMEQEKAITVLRAHGAAGLESIEGSISEGQWKNFDPKR